MIKITDIEYKHIKIIQLYIFFNNTNLYYSIVRKPLIYLIFRCAYIYMYAIFIEKG